jgi:hypothetical protein
MLRILALLSRVDGNVLSYASAHPFYPICFSNFMGLTAKWETKPQCYNLSQPNMIDKGSNGKTKFEDMDKTLERTT